MSLLKSFETQSNLNERSFLLERVFFLKKKILPFFIILFIVGAIVEVWASSRLTTYGEQIAKINEESSRLALENQLLEDQIAEKSSFYQVEQHAKLLGFGDIKNVQYIQPLDLALNH